ncbi:hypothetical protein KIW84_011634 [Lathyrus oleraceus]|uniref:Pentatricopeptide repeat-containing protein n=1 Tax=Pisum sativum TaxID=3888 RepID=A0A9D5BFI0_PEA|nr:hypothetical protein KIW84_011634 [Pisum sativum]
MGTDENPILVSKLIHFYASFNLLVDAQIVTESSNNLDPLHWNMVISLYVRNIFFEEAIPVYKEMLSKNVQPADFTYPSVIKACGELLDCDTGVELDVARHLFDNMSVRDDVSWNTIISRYAAREAVQAPGELLFRLKEDEEFVINAQKWVVGADQEAAKAYEQIDKLKKKHEKEIGSLNELVAEAHLL